MRHFILLALALTTPVQAAWIDRINGSANTNDTGQAIAVSGSAVYVVGGTGENAGGGVSNGYALVARFDRLSGQRLWTLSWVDPADPTDFLNCRKLVLDPAGDLLVGCDFGYDRFGVIKVTSAGVVSWSRTLPSHGGYPSFGNVAVDGTGAVAFVGASGDVLGLTYAEVAVYSATGVHERTLQYDGPAGSAGSQALALALTATEVVLAGYTDIPGVAAEASVVSLARNGSGVAWERFFGSPEAFGQDAFETLVVRPSGGYVVAGIVGSNTAASQDGLIVALDASGNELWQHVVDTGAGLADSLRALTLLPGGDVVAVGNSQIGPNQTDPMVVRVDASGIETWRHFPSGPGTGLEAALAVDAGPGEAVCVAGYESLANASYGMFVATYSPAGTLVDHQSYAGPLGGGSRARGVAMDHSSNCIATGGSFASGTGEDATIIRFDRPPVFSDGFESGDAAAWSPLP